MQRTNWVRKGVFGLVQLLALALALVLVYTLSGGTSAKAYIPAQFAPANGDGENANIAVAMTVTPQNPNYGETVTYQGTLQFKDYGSIASTEVTVSQDPNAPFAGAPSTQDFSWSNGRGNISGPQKAGANSWKFVVTNVPSGATLTFTKQGTVKREGQMPAGTPMSGSIAASATPSLEAPTWKPQLPTQYGPTVTKGTTCYGVMQFPAEAISDGAWMVDIKFAQLKNTVHFVNNSIVPGRNTPQNPLSANATQDTITFTDANGRDITNQIMAKAQYNPNDPSAPLYPNSLVNAFKSQTKFVDSLNWKYDPKTFTGDTWIPKGTTANVWRVVAFDNCAGGVALDGDTSRPVEAVFEVGHPAIPFNVNAFAPFNGPGTTPISAECEDLYWTSEVFHKTNDRSTVDDITIGQAMNPTNTSITVQKLGQAIGGTGSLAVSKQRPERLYYISYDKELYYYSLKDRQNHKVPTTNTPALFPDIWGKPTLELGSRPFSLGFDKNGRLWAVRNMGDTFTASLWYLDEGSSTWVKKADLKDLTPQLTIPTGDWHPRIYDLAFNANGDVYIVDDWYDITKRYHRDLLYIPASAIANYDTIKFAPTLGSATPGAKIIPISVQGGRFNYTPVYGIAYGRDGKLYGDFGPSLSGDMQNAMGVINPNTGVITPLQSVPEGGFSSNLPGAYSDLASCSFGEPTPRGEAQFKLQKSVIDPVTGAVTPAGETSANPVTMQRVTKQVGNQTVTTAEADVTYLVTVTNFGSAAGTPGTRGIIEDSLTLGGNGFKITELKVDGQVPANLRGLNTNTATFDMKARELQPGHSQTFAVKIHVVNADAMGATWGQDATICKTTGAGTPGFGFFNQVRMTDDKDGVDNNDACVPVKPESTGNLYLFKAIADANGQTIAGAVPNAAGVPQYPAGYGDLNGDLTKFQLTASPVNNVSIEGLSGVMNMRANGLNKGVGGAVVAGQQYQLAESAVTGADTSDYEFGNTYKCYNYTARHAVATTNNMVTVPAGQTITCFVVNKQSIPFETRKLAADPDMKQPANNSVEGEFGKFFSTGDSHIGNSVTAKNGIYYVKYQVQVASAGKATGNTGVVKDYFKIPEGMQWANGQSATVKFTGLGGANVNGSTSATRSFSESAVTNADGFVLADSVKDLRPAPNGLGTFEVTIPLTLKANVTEAQKQALATCNAYKLPVNGTTDTLVNPGAGITNTVALDNEFNYGATTIRDNIACVPINVDVPKIKIEKLAADPNQDYPTESFVDASQAKPSHIGNMVTLDRNGAGVLKYQIVVKNHGDATTNSGPIYDQFQLPAGLEWNGNPTFKIDTADAGRNVTITGYSGNTINQPARAFANADGYKLVESINNIRPGGYAVITIDFPVKKAANYDQHAAALAECTAERNVNGVAGWTANNHDGKGVPNTTSLGVNDVNEDSEYSKNYKIDNIACIPVGEQKVKIEKFAADPDQKYPANSNEPTTTRSESHIGKLQQVELGPGGMSGTTDLNYKIVVTNNGSVPINSGVVYDQFVMPFGLSWHGNAKVTFDTANGGDDVKVIRGQYVRADGQVLNSEQRFENVIALASDIENIKPGGTVVINVSIPAITNQYYWDNKENLETCVATKEMNGEAGWIANVTDAHGRVHGAINITALGNNDENEDTTYSKNYRLDNVACIPVTCAHVAFKIEKTAAHPSTEAAYRDNQHVGATVTPNDNGELTVEYNITLTNYGEVTGDSGAIYDSYTVPAGLKWDGNKTATITYNTGALEGRTNAPDHVINVTREQFAGNTPFLITRSVVGMPPKTPLVFTVKIPLRIDDTPVSPGSTVTVFEQHAADLGQCKVYENSGEKLTQPVTPTPRDSGQFAGKIKNPADVQGVPNTVQLINEDPTYSKTNWWNDNVACIPVKHEPKPVQIVVRKTDSITDPNAANGLKGAEFQICSKTPKYKANGSLDTVASDCKPMSPLQISQNQAHTQDQATERFVNNFAKVCLQYLPEGTTYKQADFHKYGAAFHACLGGYAANSIKTQPDGSGFAFTDLTANQSYWLVETKAPLCQQKAAQGDTNYCYSLLPEPLEFKVNAQHSVAIVTGTGASGNALWSIPKSDACNPYEPVNPRDMYSPTRCTVPQAQAAVAGDTAAHEAYRNVIVVHDPRKSTLPKSGGTGPGPMIALGAAAILLSGGYMYHKNRRGRKEKQA